MIVVEKLTVVIMQYLFSSNCDSTNWYGTNQHLICDISTITVTNCDGQYCDSAVTLLNIVNVNFLF